MLATTDVFPYPDTIMFDTLPPEAVYAAGFAFVLLLAAGRIYVGEQYFDENARFWAPARRLFVPALHRAFQRADEDAFAETDVSADELVVALNDVSVDDVRDDLAEAGYQPQPLASLATDWFGQRESASWARYHGPKPFAGAPEWLRPRQVHVRLFEDPLDEVVDVTVTAHEESNPWRPDLWRDHYRGESFDVERGVAMAAEDLGVAPAQDEEYDAL